MSCILLAPLGAVAAAVASSLCCIGPLTFVLLGVSGVTIGAGLERYRPYALGVTVAMLGIAFYLNHRTPVQQCADDGTCVPGISPKMRIFNRVILWTATFSAVVFMLIPQILAWL